MELSIVTACYNHGKYLDEMLKSVHDYKWNFEFEHIIINDGSTDEFTKEKLKEVETYEKVIVVHQENKGLAKARNAGIGIASGKYILPLDSDNRIHPQVIEESINIANDSNCIDVVYTDAEKFGEITGLWKVGHLDRRKILITNQIDACALIRKSVLNELGFYDENMPAMGNEDWELWIRFIVNCKEFCYLEKVGFDYRVDKSSMTFNENMPKFDVIRKYITGKYSLYYHDMYRNLFDEYFFYKKYMPYKEILRHINNKAKSVFKK